MENALEKIAREGRSRPKRPEVEEALALYSTEQEFIAFSERWFLGKGFNAEDARRAALLDGTLLWCVWMARDILERLPPLSSDFWLRPAD